MPHPWKRGTRKLCRSPTDAWKEPVQRAPPTFPPAIDGGGY
jgi:hypothetical protein